MAKVGEFVQFTIFRAENRLNFVKNQWKTVIKKVLEPRGFDLGHHGLQPTALLTELLGKYINCIKRVPIDYNTFEI